MKALVVVSYIEDINCDVQVIKEVWAVSESEAALEKEATKFDVEHVPMLDPRREELQEAHTEFTFIRSIKVI